MDTGAFHMLHDTRNYNILAIAYCINFYFLTHQVFIDQNRMLLYISINYIHEFYDVLVGNCNLHTGTTQYIRRTYQHRISQLMCSFQCLFTSKYRLTGRSWNAAFFQNLVKQLTILCCVYILSTRSQNGNTHLQQCFCQLYRSLTAKLYNRSIRFLQIHNRLHIFRCQRLKIQLIRNIEVCTYCLRIIIYNNRLIPLCL